MGAIQFALLFVGLRYASPSAIAIVVQLAVPFTTVLSILFLKEKVRWVRGSGMAIAFVGAALVVFKPAEFSFTAGLLAGVSLAESLHMASGVPAAVLGLGHAQHVIAAIHADDFAGGAGAIVGGEVDGSAAHSLQRRVLTQRRVGPGEAEGLARAANGRTAVIATSGVAALRR